MLSYSWDTLYCDFYSPTLLKSRSSITFSHGCQQILDDDDDDVDKETKLKAFSFLSGSSSSASPILTTSSRTLLARVTVVTGGNIILNKKCVILD